MQRVCGFCVGIVLFVSSVLSAGVVIIPLPEITGDYVTGSQPIPFQLETTFSQIDQVGLQVAGKILPGIGPGGVAQVYPTPPGIGLIPAELDFILAPDSMEGDWNIHLAGDRFNAEFAFVDSSGSPSWDFLLDGQGDMIRQITPVNTEGFPTAAYIFEAYLVVEGTVLDQVVRDDPFPLPGDANHDGMVDVGDLGILAANYGGKDREITSDFFDFNGDGSVDVGDLGILAAGGLGGEWYGVVTFEEGDFNYDGKIDVGDLGILAANYGGGVGGVGVPEPVSLVLLILGAVVLLRKR